MKERDNIVTLLYVAFFFYTHYISMGFLTSSIFNQRIHICVKIRRETAAINDEGQYQV